MGVKILFFDLDGTMLRRDKTLPDENREALIRAAERGVHIVPATGRLYGGIPAALRALPFIRYAVCCNGALIYDARTDTVLRRAEIPLPLAMRVYDRLDTLPVIYDCYLDGKSYMSRAFYGRIDEFITDPFINRMIKDMRITVDDFRGYLTSQGRGLQKILAFFQDMDARARALESLSAEFPTLAVTSSIHNDVELNAAGATKGQALRALCLHLGIDPAEAMALGDGSNDLDMLQAAGLGVAMANAEPALLAAADHVTGTCDACGAAQAIRRFCLDG